MQNKGIKLKQNYHDKKVMPSTDNNQEGYPLNNALPSNLLSIWLTTVEIHEMLLMAGVRRSSTVVMIADALRLSNNNELFMAMNKHGGTTYFYSKMAHLSDVRKSVPMQQRFSVTTTGRKRRVHCNPVRDYFIDSNNQHFGIINHALRELEGKEKKQKAKEMEQKEREQRKFCYNNLFSGQ